MTEQTDHENSITLAVLQHEVAALRHDVAALTEATSDLVSAWQAAGKTIIFAKFIAGIATAVGGAWLAFAALWHTPHP